MKQLKSVIFVTHLFDVWTPTLVDQTCPLILLLWPLHNPHLSPDWILPDLCLTQPVNWLTLTWPLHYSTCSLIYPQLTFSCPHLSLDWPLHEHDAWLTFTWPLLDPTRLLPDLCMTPSVSSLTLSLPLYDLTCPLIDPHLTSAWPLPDLCLNLDDPAKHLLDPSLTQNLSNIWISHFAWTLHLGHRE